MASVVGRQGIGTAFAYFIAFFTKGQGARNGAVQAEINTVTAYTKRIG